MPFTLAGQLAHKAQSARADDPLGLVAENLRTSSQGVLPIFAPDDWEQRRVVGLVSQNDLTRATNALLEPVGVLNGHANGYLNGETPQTLVETPPRTPTETLRALTARDVMQNEVSFIPAQFSLVNALMTLDRYDVAALPVLDAGGTYRGLITRADVLSALTGSVKPPIVGGMATPLGVWLTDGRLDGGASKLGLFLSGLTLAGCFVGAQILLVLIARALNPEWGAMAMSGRLGFDLDGSGVLNSAFFFLHGLLFLGLLRALPMAGVHAAEHQTVHAMERGLPLTVENVAKMPRAHPRCGTNLMAVMGLILIGTAHLPSFEPNLILLILLVSFFAWRFFGEVLQVVFTTRTPSKKQIESGIKAANELMAKYQAQPFADAPSPLRILNQGILFSAAGMFVGLSAFIWVLNLLARI